MAEKFPFDEEFLPVPAEALEADTSATMRDLYFRIGTMERRLEEQQAHSVADWKETLLGLVTAYDSVTGLMERWGVSPDAQQATGVSELLAIGKQILTILQNHQVEAISTIGEPLDADSSDQAGSEERANLPSGTVLREVQIGYRWPSGLLRRAKVIASRQAPPEQSGDSTVIG